MQMEARCANHFEVVFTDSEFLLNFGQLFDGETEPLIHTKVVVTPRSARTLGSMLESLIECYEAMFGAIEAKTK